MEFSDSEPYDIPIGDLLDSDCEDNSATVNPQEDGDLVGKATDDHPRKRYQRNFQRDAIIIIIIIIITINIINHNSNSIYSTITSNNIIIILMNIANKWQH